MDDDRSGTLPLQSADAKRPSVTGGKGANLARLVDAEFPVPDGFVVTTAVYDTLVDSSALRDSISTLERLEPADTERITAVSADVRSTIRTLELPQSVRDDIADQLARINADAYAVRSSATAEDLPTASFAGMHETFLGVGEADVFDGIRACLASLFTDRAVSYRLRNHVAHSDVSMAVVVQAMVDPEVAGVLFTADPVSGNRNVASVDANFGLGDTVVAGDVSPDNARVDRRTGEIVDYTVGEKQRALRRVAGEQTTELVDLPDTERETRALSDAHLRELVEIGVRIEAELGRPQDIEWAFVDGDIVVLQSRPITSLFPLPTPLPDDDELHVYFSIGHQQAMAGALPPLVVDWWQETFRRVTSRFRTDDSDDSLAVEAGGRLYVDLTPLLRIGTVRPLLLYGLDALSEPAAAALRSVFERRRDTVAKQRRRDDVKRLLRAARDAAPLVASVGPTAVATAVRTFVFGPPAPATIRELVESRGEHLARQIRSPNELDSRVEAAFGHPDVRSYLSDIAPRVVPLMLVAVLSGKILRRTFPDDVDAVVALGSGFEDEITTRMNQQLGGLADIAREYPGVESAVASASSLSDIERVDGGERFVEAFDAFIAEFGHRASSEIDLSRPRWRDDPETLLRTIRSNLTQRESGGHRTHLRALQRTADDAASRLESQAVRGRFGRVKRPVVGRLVDVYRGGIQLREFPKQGVAHYFAAVHDVVSDAGVSLASDGVLDCADDVWYLRKDELFAALDGDLPADIDVESRRQTYERHASMTAPPVLTSDGEAPTATETGGESPNTLTGTPVSAGVVEGRVRVVRDPTGESLENGEILVAPSTDPGWTPLFLNAAGLVVEVGGRMTHGALVAREYGIPAVVSVANATTTLETGERIRIDGKQGTVERLDRTE